LKRTLVIALVCAAVAAGCAGKKDRSEPPAELVSFESTLRVDKVWSSKVGGGTERLRLGLAPATDGALIFAGAHDGKAAAYDAATGKEAWKQNTELPLSAGPGFGGDLIVFGTSDGDLVALESSTGEQRWRVPVGSEVLAAPAVAAGVVVLRTVDGRLRGFSTRDGSEVWTAEQAVPALTLRGNTAPRIAGTTVVSGFSNGRIGAYALTTGEELWEAAIASPTGRNELERLVDVGPAIQITGNDVFAVCYQGRAAGIDLNTGLLLWQQDMSSFAGLGTDLNNVYVTDDFSAIVALDRRGGSVVWRQEALRLRDVTAPTRFGAAIVVGDYKGYLHWLDPADGHFLARERAGSDRITAAPLVVGVNLYVQDEDGTLTAYTIEDDSA
jgi:outer membrane protein assembly factor BamB